MGNSHATNIRSCRETTQLNKVKLWMWKQKRDFILILILWNSSSISHKTILLPLLCTCVCFSFSLWEKKRAELVVFTRGNDRIMDQGTRKSHGHDQALASDTFDKFCNASTLKDILALYRQLLSVCKLVPTNFQEFFPKIRVRYALFVFCFSIFHPTPTIRT